MVQKMSVEDLLELSSHVMNYAVIEERLMEPLRNKWEDAKKTKLERVVQYKARRRIVCIEPFLFFYFFSPKKLIPLVIKFYK